MHIPRRLLIALAALAGALVAACNSSGTDVLGGSVTRVEVAPGISEVAPLGTLQLVATAYDAMGEPVTGVTFTWTTNGTAIATVSGAGLVTGVGTGTATITASTGGHSGTGEVSILPPAPSGALIDLIPSVTYQTLTGWEAVAQIGVIACQSFPAYRDELLDKTVNQLGLNRVRLEVRSGVENPVDWFGRWVSGEIDTSVERANRYTIINDNSNPSVIDPAGFHFSIVDFQVENVVEPLRELLAQRGEELYVNLTYVDFGASPFEHASSPQEYAEFMVATFQHLQSTWGWVPDAVEIILEPDNTQAWSAAAIGQALVAAGARLEAAGFTPDFIGPSTLSQSAASDYFDQMLGVPRLTEFLTDLSYHRYAGVSTGALQNIASRAMQHGLRTGMLEHIASDYVDLHQDLTVGRNSAWEQFALAYCAGSDNGAQYFLIDDAASAFPRVTLSSRARYLRHYFLHARLGAVRVGALSGDAAFSPVAFRNTDGRYTVVVRASSGGTFQIRNLPPATYGTFFTTGAQTDVHAADVILRAGQALSASIPAAGVITIHQR